jgi:hypothetical protein
VRGADHWALDASPPGGGSRKDRDKSDKNHIVGAEITPRRHAVDTLGKRVDFLLIQGCHPLVGKDPVNAHRLEPFLDVGLLKEMLDLGPVGIGGLLRGDLRGAHQFGAHERCVKADSQREQCGRDELCRILLHDLLLG